jgi:glycosyltransferase involved in cell wall biosynthesis
MSEATPRIAVYLRLLSGGGAERILINLMQGFLRRGVKVDLVLNKIDGPYLAQVPPEVRIVDLKATRLLVGLPKLARYLRQEKPTALLTGLHYTNEIAIWAKRLAGSSTRVVVSEHNTLSIHGPSRDSDRFSPLLAKLFYPWADGIVAVSHGVAKDLANVTGLPLNRIQVIYNPVITPDLLAKSKESVDHPWFAPGQPPVIIGVGRLNEQKDFPTLIRAFAQVLKTRPARLMILGVGPQRSQLNNLVRELGVKDEVTFVGFVQNPYPYMARAAVFVLSSIEEGLPTVLIEAMAVGTPVISTNCPSGPDEILDNGKYGLLIPVGNTEAIAQAILDVLSGNSSSVDPAWLDQFSLETATENYLDYLRII